MVAEAEGRRGSGDEEVTLGRSRILEEGWPELKRKLEAVKRERKGEEREERG